MERLPCGSAHLLVWRDVVPAAHLERLFAGLVRTQQLIVRKPEAASVLAAHLEPLLPGLRVTWGQHVTYSVRAEPISLHCDRDLDPATTHKLLLYGDDVAGTFFRETLRAESPEVLVPASPGTVVVFPIHLWHRGEPHRDSRRKRTLGLRLTLHEEAPDAR